MDVSFANPKKFKKKKVRKFNDLNLLGKVSTKIKLKSK